MCILECSPITAIVLRELVPTEGCGGVKEL